jgi:gamma-glutamylcyclotransferase (GGCT)/AIG2-like uncharacterized protein YtfP
VSFSALANYGSGPDVFEGLMAQALFARIYEGKESIMPMLFSYGTLQQEEVQLATFGRKLAGQNDALVGYEQSLVRIDDLDVIAKSGKSHHPIVKFNGDPRSQVSGSVFEITEEELRKSDEYEVRSYRRVSTRLASGITAWVYVDARYAP